MEIEKSKDLLLEEAMEEGKTIEEALEEVEEEKKEEKKILSLADFKRQPIVGGQKVGRNWPCTCGSGKKYKNCCLKKAYEQYSEQVRIREQQIEAMEALNDNNKKKIIEDKKEEPKAISSGAAKSQSTKTGS